MKKVLLAGAVEKSDLVLYLAKVYTSLNQKVLLIDATGVNTYHSTFAERDEKTARLIEVEGFDIALQTFSLSDLEQLLKQHKEKIESYDILLIDTDLPQSVAKWEHIDDHLLVSSYEKQCIQKNLEIIQAFFDKKKDQTHIEFQLVLYHVDTVINQAYIEQQFMAYPIVFSDDPFYIPFDEVDYAIKIETQHNQRLNLKRISRSYKKLLQLLIQQISNFNAKSIKQAIR